ncbi:MAG: hypothetical protein JST14_04255, partial [Bacteroidetes bacterium]|nr:hypothetical protein [Bacteroidota bacterium]
MRILAIILFVVGTSIAAHGQGLIEKYDQWKANWPRVMPLAILDRQTYTPGDSVFYKVYFLTEDFRKVEGRRVIHLTLVNHLGKACAISDAPVKDGVGHNQFVLPDTLGEGFYRLTFSHEWMDQYQPDEYYQEEIRVVTGHRINRRVADGIRFFPEGGSFVSGILNRMVVTGPPDLHGELQDDAGNTLTSVRLNGHGIGSITFTPQPGKKYNLAFKGRKHDLPEPSADGLTILLNQGTNGTLRVLMSVPHESAVKREELAVVLASRGTIYYTSQVKWGSNDFISFQIQGQDMPRGPALLSVVNPQTGRTYLSRWTFIQKPLPTSFEMRTEPHEISRRGAVGVTLTQAQDGSKLPEEFLISASQDDSDSTFSFGDKMLVAAAGFDAASFALDAGEAPDLWMLTQQGPLPPWEQIVRGSYSRPAPMNTLLHKMGRAVFADTGKPLPDSSRLDVLLMRELVNYELIIVRDGATEFPFLFDFWGKDEMLYKAEYRGEELRNVSFNWLPNRGPWRPASGHIVLDEEEPYVSYVGKLRRIQESYSFYHQPDTVAGKTENPNALVEDELMGADVTIKIQDYLIFPTMEETIREIIPYLRHRKHKGVSVVRVVYSDHDNYTTGDPLYIIDGIITTRTDFFLSLKPSDILTIKIVTDQ